MSQSNITGQICYMGCDVHAAVTDQVDIMRLCHIEAAGSPSSKYLALLRDYSGRPTKTVTTGPDAYVAVYAAHHGPPSTTYRFALANMSQPAFVVHELDEMVTAFTPYDVVYSEFDDAFDSSQFVNALTEAGANHKDAHAISTDIVARINARFDKNTDAHPRA